ncbi:MAG: branched-chain amino acid aminotransferase [Acholeplasmataceae bacterium]
MKPLKFQYTKTHVNFIAFYEDGKWQDGVMEADDHINISKMSTALHYGQEAFEGLKAYMRKDGKVQIFRVDENAKRFKRSCSYLLMPPVDESFFIDAVVKTVQKNLDFVPPYGSGGSLYIRPYMIGIGSNLGLRPSSRYLFGVVVTPVGNYFENGLTPVDLMVSKYDRAAPNGTGSYKIGGNYAASLYAQGIAKSKGYADCIFLDPRSHEKIEEVGAANFFGITKDGKYLTPKSPSILKSITNMSLQYIATEMLKMDVILGDVYVKDLDHLAEAGACGTAAIITPIRKICDEDYEHMFPTQDEPGEITHKLFDILTGIQVGDIKDPDHWMTIVN